MFTECPDMVTIKYSEHESNTLSPAEKMSLRGTVSFIATSMSSDYFQSEQGRYKESPDNRVGLV